MVSLVFLFKAVEVTVLFILVRNASCNFSQDRVVCSPDTSNETSTCIPQEYIETYNMIKDLCAATGRECKLCPLNWLAFNGKCYLFSEERNNWTASKENCRRRNAEILSMEDLDEQEFITKQVTSMHGHFWIGLRKHGSQWKWETGGAYKQSITEATHSCTTFGREMTPESCFNPNKWICEKNMTSYVT
ncbi:C-type lectin domain family 2 member B-like [Hyperolius riggenbachi]|uniref:C-type lectin domain family 2 member B-like n=1 Tax=Hyperolius riggenbachi TaxID=752182 RepID=UPI0035A33C07